jgi:hypothetical protein
MDDKNLNIEIFDNIDNFKEYYKVCKSFNFLISLGMLADTEHLKTVSQFTFRRLTRISNGN